MMNIFEQPWLLLIAAVVTFVILLILRPRIASLKFVIPICIALAAFGTDFLVQTDLEKIKETINTGAKALEDQDCQKIESIISEDYKDSSNNNKQRFMARCKSKLSTPLVEKAIVSYLSIDISQTKKDAAVIFTARLLIDKQSDLAQFAKVMSLKIKADLNKNSLDNWLINQIDILEINGQPANWSDIRY